MASNTLGYAFAPTFDAAEEGKYGGSPAMTAQSPLQVLSYRLPKFKGAGGGLSPLQGDMRSGALSSAVIESVLRTVLGSGDVQGWLSGMSSGPSAPGSPGSAAGDPGAFWASIWQPPPTPIVRPGGDERPTAKPQPAPPSPPPGMSPPTFPDGTSGMLGGSNPLATGRMGPTYPDLYHQTF